MQPIPDTAQLDQSIGDPRDAIRRPQNVGPDDPPWRDGPAIAVWVLSVGAILIFPVFLIIPYYMVSGIPLPEDAGSDPTVILLSLAAIVPAHLFTLAVAWRIVTQNRQFPFFEMIGWKMGPFRWWYFPAIIITVFALMVGVTAVFPEQDNDLLKIIRSSPAAAYSLALLATLFAPFVEEVVYRGLLYSAFQRSIGTVWAVTAVTLMFAGVHYFQYWGSWGSMIAITLLSLVLTLSRALSGNLLPAVILHFLFNGLQSAAIVTATMNKEAIPPPAEALFNFLAR